MASAPPDAKLLIVGASGFIGSSLIRAWRPRSYVATYLTRPIKDGVFFDIANHRLADRLLRRGHGFTHAVLAQGVTKLDQCAQMRNPSATVNVTGTARAIEDLLDAGVYPIYLSSDAVFDGGPGLRTEEDPPHPILSYGCDKVEVEKRLATVSEPWAILRLTKVIAGFSDNRNPLTQWLNAIRQGSPIRCAVDQTLTPIDVADVVRAITFFVGTGTKGIFNVAGSEMVTRYELLQRLLARLPELVRHKAEVRPCSISDIPSVEPLPRNCSLSNQKFVAASGIAPRSLDQICDEFCASEFGESENALGEAKSETRHFPSLRGMASGDFPSVAG